MISRSTFSSYCSNHFYTVNICDINFIKRLKKNFKCYIRLRLSYSTRILSYCNKMQITVSLPQPRLRTFTAIAQLFSKPTLVRPLSFSDAKKKNFGLYLKLLTHYLKQIYITCSSMKQTGKEFLKEWEIEGK